MNVTSHNAFIYTQCCHQIIIVRNVTIGPETVIRDDVVTPEIKNKTKEKMRKMRPFCCANNVRRHNKETTKKKKCNKKKI